MDHLVEHEFATLPLRFGHDGLQDHVILLLVHGVVDRLARTLCKLSFFVKQVVGLVFDLVEVAEFEAAHELLLHVLLNGVNLAQLQHANVG